jgi:hypothetical protein
MPTSMRARKILLSCHCQCDLYDDMLQANHASYGAGAGHAESRRAPPALASAARQVSCIILFVMCICSLAGVADRVA